MGAKIGQYAVTLVVLLLMTAPAAKVQGKGGEDQREQQLVNQGRALFKKGDYQQALEHFEAAFARTQHAGLYYVIGRCHQELDHPQQALDAFAAFLLWPEAPEATKTKVEVYIVELEERLKTGTLLLTSDQPQTKLWLDGKQLEALPVQPLELTAGSHVVVARCPGYQELHRVVEVVGAKQVQLDLHFTEQVQAQSAPASAPAIVQSSAVDQVDSEAGFAPWSFVGLGAGGVLAAVGAGLLIWGEFDHQQIVQAKGYGKDEYISGMTEVRAHELNELGYTKKISGLVVAGVAATTALVGGILLTLDLLSSGDASEIGETAVAPDGSAQ